MVVTWDTISTDYSVHIGMFYILWKHLPLIQNIISQNIQFQPIQDN